MLARTPVVDAGGLKDPLASVPGPVPSSSGSAPPECSPSFASSFVFVESSAQTPKISRNLSRHSTVIHNSPESIENQSTVLVFLPKEETLANVPNVKLVHPIPSIVHDSTLTLIITNYRAAIVSGEIEKNRLIFSIPLASILDVKSKQSTNSFALDIKTKDCRFFQLSCEDSSVNKTGFLKLLNSLLIFNGLIIPSGDTCLEDGTRSRIDHLVDHDLARLSPSGNHHTCISDLNEDFSVCSTYPRRLIVPKTASRDMVMGAAKFRDKGRLPVLSWASSGYGSIWRSSQPKSSLLNRSSEDEQYLKAMNVMYIIDCRPMLNAYANIANAGGVESLGNYHEGIELWFASIQNIHHVRDSWEKFFLLSQQHSGMSSGGGSGSSNNGSLSGWYSGLEASGWMDHLVSILRAVNVLVEKISSGSNVLCRCSHGLDRTPQVVSLGMICLDQYYRTIEGFAVLIEKEWLRMGHRFGSRYSIGKTVSDETSPIFSQWIDCVYQIMQQFPEAFEFTPNYLIWILMGMLSGRFLNFSNDCEKERIEMDGQRHGSPDVWTDEIWKHREQFLNRNYKASDESSSKPPPLNVDYRLAIMRVFSDVWLTPNRPTI